jgi:cytochrome c peroxidase
MNNVDEADVVSKVQNASYADDFREVFGANAFNDTLQAYDNIAVAIAAFETSREMNPFTSKFDAVMAGRATFTTSEQSGFDLFNGPVAKCANCHTVDSPAARSLFTNFNYYNIATPINTSNPAYVADNGFRDGGLGDRIDLSAAEQVAEQGKFRTPTLRNVELTAPYMHNGVYSTLEDVIRHYDIIATDSMPISFQTEVINDIANELNFQLDIPLGLSNQNYQDLENFMLTLTDGFM